MSTQSDPGLRAVTAFFKGVGLDQPHFVLSELFGFLSSSEGAAIIHVELQETISSLEWTTSFAPTAFGSFFLPCGSTAEAFLYDPRSRKVYCSDKFTLVMKYPFSDLRSFPGPAGLLEFFDTRTSMKSYLEQDHVSSFEGCVEGSHFNSIACWIWFGYEPSSVVVIGSRVTGTSTFYPYGLTQLKADHGDFTVDCSSTTLDGNVCCSNWYNIVVFFPAIKLKEGDRMTVLTHVDARTFRPSYTFTVEILAQNYHHTVNLGHEDLYCWFTRLPLQANKEAAMRNIFPF